MAWLVLRPVGGKNNRGEEKGGKNGGWRRGLRGRDRGRDRTGQGFGTRKGEELFR